MRTNLHIRVHSLKAKYLKDNRPSGHFFLVRLRVTISGVTAY